jgi:hypothetical protein
MFANCSLAGQNFGMPDVCLTPAPPAPPVPIPYPNMAQLPMAIPNQFKTLIQMMPQHNLGTTIPLSNGDEAGVAGGVMSGTIIGPSRHLKGSTKVMIGGMPATRLLDTAMQNSTNVPAGMTIVPSQTKVMIMS